MRKGSGRGQGQGRAEQRDEDVTNAAAAEAELRSQIVPRAQGEMAAHAHSSDSTLREHIATIWRLLRAMEASPESATHACVSAFEEAFALHASHACVKTSVGVRLVEEQAVGGIPVDRLIDPLLASAFRAARRHWQGFAGAQNPESEVGSSSVRNQGELLLLGLLGTLDEPKRVLVLLADMEQLSSPEIAALMGLRLDIVYDELRKARKAFVRARKRLEHIGATGDAETEARELLALARARFSPDPAAQLTVSEQLRVRGWRDHRPA